MVSRILPGQGSEWCTVIHEWREDWLKVRISMNSGAMDNGLAWSGALKERD